MRAEVLTAITRSSENNVNSIAVQSIEEAQSEVAGYLSARYDIQSEFEKTPESADRVTMVVKLVRDIAIYNCHQFSAPVNMPETRIRAYENALKFMRDVQAEKAGIPGLKRLNETPGGSVSSSYIQFGGGTKRNNY